MEGLINNGERTILQLSCENRRTRPGRLVSEMDGTTGKKRDLSGWVKNLPDGAVEALVSGPESGVRQMLQDFLNGPSAAEVLSVEARECDPPAKTGFHLIKST